MEFIVILICVCLILALAALYNLVIANATYLVSSPKGMDEELVTKFKEYLKNIGNRRNVMILDWNEDSKILVYNDTRSNKEVKLGLSGFYEPVKENRRELTSGDVIAGTMIGNMLSNIFKK
jgi:hypothetical protein